MKQTPTQYCNAIKNKIIYWGKNVFILISFASFKKQKALPLIHMAFFICPLLSTPALSQGPSGLPLCWMPNEEPGTCLPFQCQTQVRKTNIQSVIPSTCLWDLAKPASATDYREFNFSPSVCNSVMVLDQSEWARSSGITKAPQASVAYDSFRGAVRGQEGVFIHTCHSRPRWMAATSMPPRQRTSEGFFLTGT